MNLHFDQFPIWNQNPPFLSHNLTKFSHMKSEPRKAAVSGFQFHSYWSEARTGGNACTVWGPAASLTGRSHWYWLDCAMTEQGTKQKLGDEKKMKKQRTIKRLEWCWLKISVIWGPNMDLIYCLIDEMHEESRSNGWNWLRWLAMKHWDTSKPPKWPRFTNLLSRGRLFLPTCLSFFLSVSAHQPMPSNL